MNLYEEDSELMEKVKNGDKTAYELIVIKYRASAVNFAHNFISDLQECEDIVQECFVKIYIHRDIYKPIHAFKTYLFTVIRNYCIDYLRKNKKNSIVSIDEITDISGYISPEDLFIQSEQTDKAIMHFAELPGDYKTALYLFAVDEMSYKDTAKIMLKSVPQVKIIIHRARKKLKKLCEGDEKVEK